jgi:putative transposase
LDCRNREVISSVASPGGYRGDEVRDLRLEAVEKRFGQARRAIAIQWLSDNGSAYTAEQAREIGLMPLTTSACSPQTDGMAECFMKTVKRDYITHMHRPVRLTALRNLAIAFVHYNEAHSALKCRSPREFRRLAAAST